MSRKVDALLARLRAAGLRFVGPPPDGAHRCCRGHEPRTWLVRRSSYPNSTRARLDERIYWEVGGPPATASGGAVLLDLPVKTLAGSDDLVAYVSAGARRELSITTLDAYALLRQHSIPVRRLLLVPRVGASRWPRGAECVVEIPASSRRWVVKGGVKSPEREPEGPGKWRAIVVEAVGFGASRAVDELPVGGVAEGGLTSDVLTPVLRVRVLDGSTEPRWVGLDQVEGPKFFA